MDLEWLSALVLVALLAGFMWRGGASAAQIASVIGLVVLAILATALCWDALISGDG